MTLAVMRLIATISHAERGDFKYVKKFLNFPLVTSKFFHEAKWRIVTKQGGGEAIFTFYFADFQLEMGYFSSGS